MDEALYRLEIEPLDLGDGIKGVSLDLVDRETGEPPAGQESARIWAAIVRALAGNAPWTLDFFAHLDRVREFCERHGVIFREPAASRALLIPSPAEPLAADADRTIRRRNVRRSRGRPVAGKRSGTDRRPGESRRGRLPARH